ncbi:MAG TPA: GNAT family N-acetyltransferase [Rhizomicrobium sp.]|jgi:aminoglycoside 6'-N-acetyltransferase I
MFEIRILKSGDESVLTRVADGVFDNEVDPKLVREFLADPHHHIAVAIDDGIVVASVSGVDYIHPDKPRELWINEVAVAASHHRRGIAKSTLNCLIAHARTLGCHEAWVLTDKSNTAACALYESQGGASMGDEMEGFEFKLKR